MDAESWVGRTLDERYRVEDVLGEGGMGVVLAARHVVLGHGVAIKLMRPDAGPVWRRRFEQEARACSQIDNVYDFGELDDGTPFLAMELLEGRDLADKIYSDGPLSAAEAIDYGLQVCEALGAAHALGIVHRDVKPANLFLPQRPDGSACIKLLDFGISKHPPEGNVPGSLTGTHALLGSPQFMSPEQLASSRSVDARTDIWSLGVTLFELMTLDYPFAGGSLAEICTAIMRDEPRRLRGDRPSCRRRSKTSSMPAWRRTSATACNQRTSWRSDSGPSRASIWARRSRCRRVGPPACPRRSSWARPITPRPIWPRSRPRPRCRASPH